MALLKWKIGDMWVSLYANAIKNRLRKDKNLSDLMDIAQSRINLEIFGDNNTTHYHDNRYFPPINKCIEMVKGKFDKLKVKVTGDVDPQNSQMDNDGTISLEIKNVNATRVKFQTQGEVDEKYVLMGQNDTCSKVFIDPILKYSSKNKLFSAKRFQSEEITGRDINGTTIRGDKVYGAVWNDYAEFFPRGKDKVEPGDIVMLDVEADKEAYVRAINNDCVIGVCSDEASHIIGGENPPEGEDFFEFNNKSYIPIALAGRVRVKYKGEAKKGYKVVASNIPGVAQKYDKSIHTPDQILGFLVEQDDLKNEIRRLRIKIK